MAAAAILPATAICMVIASTSVRAGNIQWIGEGSWSDAANWKLLPSGEPVVPGEADNVFIYTDGPNIDAPGAVADLLTVSGANSSLTVSSGGTLTTNSQTHLGRGTNTVGTATVSGVGAVWNAFAIYLGTDGGAGTLTVSAGGKVNGRLGLDQSGSTLIITGDNSEVNSDQFRLLGGKTVVSEGGLLSAGSLFSLRNAHLFIGGGTTNAADAKAPGFIRSGAKIAIEGGTATINFNHTDQTRKYEFSPVLSGGGILEFVNGATVLTGNSAGFTGATNIREKGTLVVKGSLSGSDVNVWGVLAGNGDVKSATINGKGRIEPGNSIGTLHVRGDFSMAPGSVYRAEISGTDSDLIDVGGQANIQSETIEIVRDTASTSPLLPGKRYTLITAAGGLTVGTPQRAVADFPFLSLTLSNDANNGYLTLSRSAEAFTTLAHTPNEVAVAAVIDAAGTSNPLWQQVVGAGEAQATAAFGSLAGASFHASVPAALSTQSYQLRDAVYGRLQDLGTGVPGAVTATGDGRVVELWAQGLGSWGKLDGSSNATGIEQSLGGVISGADVTFDGRWRLGLAGGYSRSKFDALDDSASATSDSYHLAAYGGGQIGAWGLRGGASYSWHDVSGSRQVNAVNLVNQLSSDNTATTGQIFGEVGYRVAVSDRAMLEPFANLAYVHVDSGDINETGGPSAISGSTAFDTTYSTLGLRGQMAVAEGLTVRGALGWRHAMGDVTPIADVAFVSGGSPFALEGAPIARNAFVTEAGFDYALSPNATVGLAYAGQFASDASNNSIKADFKLQF
ncbi:autotransporter domain-containing protein [Corticibacterium sp. UT-5YL-CI-8]|nr:autotransporter domain-containing protein [Tianweitania sp. UT-5YL-CI-8]